MSVGTTDRPHAAPRAPDGWDGDTRTRVLHNGVLTVAIFVPLTWAFVTVNNFYPVAVWSLFSEPRPASEPFRYYWLRGETVEGRVVDYPRSLSTQGLRVRAESMAYMTVRNDSLRVQSPHPENVRVLDRVGGVAGLPPGVRVPEMLRAWGDTYNRRLPGNSPDRLKAIQLDEFERPGGISDPRDHFLGSMRVEL